MNFKFSPIVEVDTDILNRDFVLVTAPHLVTDKMWDILHNCDAIFDIGVYTMKRKNQTQFEFYPNPGYTIDQVKFIVTMGTYIATVYDQLLGFWGQGIETHYRQIRQILDIKFPQSVDTDLAKYVYQSWITEEARTRLERAYEKQIAHAGLNDIDFTQSRLDKAQAAENRLFYAKPEDYGITDEVKSSRLSQIAGLIQHLERDNASMFDRSDKTLAYRAEAQTAIDHCLNLLDSEDIDSTTLFESWIETLTTLNNCADELANLRKKFDDKIGFQFLKNIIALAPPAK